MFNVCHKPRSLKDLVYLLNDSSVLIRDIDIRYVRDLGGVFLGSVRSDWDGLKYWDVSCVTSMSSMFAYSNIDFVDLNVWDVSNVEDMSGMFKGTSFRGNISKWDVSSVEDMNSMFYGSRFNGDISSWRPRNVVDIDEMFYGSSFNGDLSKWDMPSLRFKSNVFEKSPLAHAVPLWYLEGK